MNGEDILVVGVKWYSVESNVVWYNNNFLENLKYSQLVLLLLLCASSFCVKSLKLKKKGTLLLCSSLGDYKEEARRNIHKYFT